MIYAFIILIGFVLFRTIVVDIPNHIEVGFIEKYQKRFINTEFKTQYDIIKYVKLTARNNLWYDILVVLVTSFLILWLICQI